MYQNLLLKEKTLLKHGITPTSFLPIKAAGERTRVRTEKNKYYGQRNSRLSILTVREGRKHHAREAYVWGWGARERSIQSKNHKRALFSISSLQFKGVWSDG